MKKEIEQVVTHCKHKDCIYRKPFGPVGECCMYAAIEHEARGCKISECQRYTAGDKIRPRINPAIEIYWEYDLDANIER